MKNNKYIVKNDPNEDLDIFTYIDSNYYTFIKLNYSQPDYTLCTTITNMISPNPLICLQSIPLYLVEFMFYRKIS